MENILKILGIKFSLKEIVFQSIEEGSAIYLPLFLRNTLMSCWNKNQIGKQVRHQKHLTRGLR
jgi:hypothetical protein